MVGIVLVSHSRPLALSVQELVRSMTGPALPLAVAAGVGDDHKELGTDAVEIAEAIVSVRGKDGVLVLMDMGSAILSSETALDLLDEPLRAEVRFCAAPFVEGAVASGVTANLGSTLDEVCAEALSALRQKQVALYHNAGPAAATAAPAKNGHAPWETMRVKILNPHGLHARPAAKLITSVKPFRADITVRNLTNQRGPASVKSLSSLAALEILHGNEVEFAAAGDDASVALQEIGKLAREGFGESTAPAVKTGTAPKKAAAPATIGDGKPVPVSGGVIIGPAIFFHPGKLDVPQAEAGDTACEIDRLQNALAIARKNLEQRRDEMASSAGADNAGIFDAQALALQDPELVEGAVRLIREKKQNAAAAWDHANGEIIARYEALLDPYLRERAVDLEDVGRQVLALLVGKSSAAPSFTEPGVLIAGNLTPFEVSRLPRDLVLGVILLDGGPTAHSSILLKVLGIPAIVQARTALAAADWNAANLIGFDGTAGQIWLNPDDRLAAEICQRQIEDRERSQEETKSAGLPAATLDGHRVEIFANIGDVSEVAAAFRSGAEGVGLLRTEFLFLDRETAPTEEEQVEALSAIAKKMNGKPLVVRTLDAGGDKELPYLDTAHEDNPFLGVRAIRLCFSHAGLFDTQLRAILRAGYGHDLRIMFPMIAQLSDLDRATEVLEKVHADLEREKIPHLWPVKTGIMIEIPSAALLAESMARQADFFSIGTNDLTQYTLAADRGNPELSAYQDALHPSVLRLIEMVVRGARKHDRLVAVCGEAASDDRAAAVFVGLGVDELSLTSAKIPHIKACLRKQSLTALQKLAHSALHCHTAAEVRALL